MSYLPRKYQWIGAYYLADRHGALCGFKPGLGKTLTTLKAWQVLLEQSVPLPRVLVVTPPNLKEMWQIEIKKVLGLDAHIYQGKVKGGYEDVSEYPIVITHYPHFRGRGRKTPDKLTQPLMLHKWDLVILDEVHAIKNRKSQRTKWIKKLDAKRKWGLSGTLIAEWPSDLWSVLNWVDRKEFPHFWPFVTQWCTIEEQNYGGGRWVKKPGPVKPGQRADGTWSTEVTLAALKERVKDYIIMMNREDVGLELPPVQMIDMPLTMADDQTKYFNVVKKELVIMLTEELGDPDVWDLRSDHTQLIIRNAASRFIRLTQVSSDPTVFFPKVSNTKLEWLENYIESGGDPAVIMTRFRHTRDNINHFLQQHGVWSKYVVGTYEALSEGLNLQHLHVLIAWDPAPSRKTWEQARYRIDRMGQTEPCTIYRLKASSTDYAAWAGVDRKEQEVQVINSWLRRELYEQAYRTNEDDSA